MAQDFSYKFKVDTSFWIGVKDCVPTLLGYLSIGFAAGVVEKTAGLSIAEIALMSLILYAGSAQFILAGMFAVGSPVFSVVFTILFVNIRHLLLSAALAPYFQNGSFWKNMLIGSQLTDETFGVAVNRLTADIPNKRQWMLGLNMTAHVNWIAANLIGAYVGSRIPDPQKYSLDFAMPSMFVGLLVLQMAARKKFAVDTIVAVSSSVVCLGIGSVLSGNLGVITAIILAGCIGMAVEQWK